MKYRITKAFLVLLRYICIILYPPEPDDALILILLRIGKI